MKRIIGLAAAAVLTLGLVPLGASADHQEPWQEVRHEDAAVGVEFGEGKTCVYAEKAEYGHAAAKIGGGPEVRPGNAGPYDKHNETEATGDDSMCKD